MESSMSAEVSRADWAQRHAARVQRAHAGAACRRRRPDTPPALDDRVARGRRRRAYPLDVAHGSDHLVEGVIRTDDAGIHLLHQSSDLVGAFRVAARHGTGFMTGGGGFLERRCLPSGTLGQSPAEGGDLHGSARNSVGRALHLGRHGTKPLRGTPDNNENTRRHEDAHHGYANADRAPLGTRCRRAVGNLGEPLPLSLNDLLGDTSDRPQARKNGVVKILQRDIHLPRIQHASHLYVSFCRAVGSRLQVADGLTQIRCVGALAEVAQALANVLTTCV